ncbi:hypothetical protein BBP40_006435 [Aspergillus hancockii]|nr:hypothetical protein BBP40_006435 [Aspergillus hancockii]
MDRFDVEGQSVVIAGGSKGLGRELARQLTSQGASVTVVARTPGPLEATPAVDLTDLKQVEDFITSLPEAPSILFCVAGGTADEIGFFADVPAQCIKSCMDRNYFAAAYISHALLRRWLKEPPAAYTPTKAATRALADTLREEVLLYRSQQDIRVHCSFPGTIYTDAFYQEQQQKPGLLKELEGSEQNGGGLSAAKVAEITIAGLKKGQFFITMDTDTELLLNNMRGPSPRDSPIQHPHTIHPTTLDTSFQSPYPALADNGRQHKPIMVPTFVKSLLVSTNISSTPGSQLKVTTSAQGNRTNVVKASLMLIHEYDGGCVSVIAIEERRLWTGLGFLRTLLGPLP